MSLAQNNTMTNIDDVRSMFYRNFGSSSDLRLSTGVGSWNPSIDGAYGISSNPTYKNSVLYTTINQANDKIELYVQKFTLVTKNGASYWKAGAATPINKDVDAISMKKAFFDLESKYLVDIDGDGLVGSPLFVLDSGATYTLKASNLAEANGAHSSFAIVASGKAKTTLNINNDSGSFSEPIKLGAESVDYENADGIAARVDKVLSNYKMPFAGVGAGIGSGLAGNLNAGNVDFINSGSLISTYLLDLFGLNSSSGYSDYIIGGLLAGFAPRSNGSINFNNVNYDFVRYLPTDENQNPDNGAYDALTAMVIIGSGGGTGALSLKNSTISSWNPDATVTIAEDAGSVGTLKLDHSAINLHGIYTSHLYNDDQADPNFDIGNGGSSDSYTYQKLPNGTVQLKNDSGILMTGSQTEVTIGSNGGIGTLTLDHSAIVQHAERDWASASVAYSTATSLNPADELAYSHAWCASYLSIGKARENDPVPYVYDQSDTVVATGSLTLNNGSEYSIFGPHAGIQLGDGGKNASGTLQLMASKISVMGGGAMLNPDYDESYIAAEQAGQNQWGNNPANGAYQYLAAGYNDSGIWNHDYFTYVNVGGRGWGDAPGGTGLLELKAGSQMKVFAQELDNPLSLDSTAGLNIGYNGTRGTVIVDSSSLQVGGSIRVEPGSSYRTWDTSDSNKLALASTGALIIKNGGTVDCLEFESTPGFKTYSAATQSGTYNTAYTYVASNSQLSAEHAVFNKGSSILGSGAINLIDGFASQDYTYDPSFDATIFNTANMHSGLNSDICFYDALVSVGDTYTQVTKAGSIVDTVTLAKGTLTFNDNASDNATLVFSNTKFQFQIGKTSADQIDINGFNLVDFTQSTINIVKDSGFNPATQSSYKLFDLSGSTATINGLDSVNLTGVSNASLSYNDQGLFLNF